MLLSWNHDKIYKYGDIQNILFNFFLQKTTIYIINNINIRLIYKYCKVLYFARFLKILVLSHKQILNNMYFFCIIIYPYNYM